MPDPEQASDRDPGAPIPRNELDPELVSLRRPLPRAGPVLAASVLIFCLFMMFRLRADLLFALADQEPREIDAVAAVVDDAGLDNRHLRIFGVPDRSFVAQVATGVSGVTGHRIAPVLGSDDRAWLFLASDTWRADAVAYDEIYSGRLRRVADLPFAEGLREHVRERGAQPRHVQVEAVRAALAGDGRTIATPAGDSLSLASDLPVTIRRRIAGRAHLIAARRDDRADERTWSEALTAAGLLPAGQSASETTEAAVHFDVPAPNGLAEIRTRLASANLYEVGVAELLRTHQTTWGELRGESGGLTFPAGEPIAWSTIASITVAVPHEVPGDAVVLLTGETPEAYWYVPPLFVLLALFAALFVWALYLSLARAREADPTTAQPPPPDAESVPT